MQPLQWFTPPGVAEMLQGQKFQVLASVEISQHYITFGARPPGKEGGLNNQEQILQKPLAFGIWMVLPILCFHDFDFGVLLEMLAGASLEAPRRNVKR